MTKRLLKDGVIYGVSSILSQGIPVVIVPIYTRILAPDSYGCLDILAVFASLINLTVALEISQGLARHYAEAQSEYEKIKYASSSMWFTVGAYFLFAFFSLLFSESLTLLFLDSLQWKYTFQIAIIAMAGNGIFYFLQNLLRWKLQPKRYAMASIVYVIVYSGFGVFFVAGLKTGIVGVFFGQIIGAITGGIFAWCSAREMYRILFAWDKCKQMLHYSLPLVPSSIFVLVANYIDRIAIKSLMTLSDVGVYGIGFRFASVVNLAMVGFYSALTPLIYQYHQKESTPKELARIFRYCLSGTIPLIIGISLFSKEILWIFTTPEYYAAWTVIPILAGSSVLIRMYVFAPGLDIAKKTKTIALINMIAAGVNGALNFLLIPFMGINGAAVATLISAVVMFWGYMHLSQKYYHVVHQWRDILISSVIAVMVIVGGIYYCRNGDNFTMGIDACKGTAFIISSLFIIWILTRDMRKR